jgi:hypothetical protein
MARVYAWRNCIGLIALLFGNSPVLSAEPSTQPTVRAANEFLTTLSATQRAKVVYPWTDDAQRARWSNFPTAVVPRSGISLKEMNEPQRAAALALLQAVLSPMGYEKVNLIRMADDDFKANGSKRGPRGNGPPPAGAGSGPPPGMPPGLPPGTPQGQPPGPPSAGGRGGGPPKGDLFGSDLYYFSFVGEPSTQSPWMMQFGGHHLALNVTFSGATGVMTPSLTGAQPAVFTVNGRQIRPLGRESDEALALAQSLRPDQQQRAFLNYRVADLVLGPGQDGKKIAPEGLKAAAMTAPQKQLLIGLMQEWVGIMNDAAAAKRLAQLQADLDETWFAWSGPSNSQPGNNITAYYRIQGPHVVIEYAPQSDEPANHVHTIYRDPTNDYGTQFNGAQ